MQISNNIITKSAEVLKSGQTLLVDENTIINDKHLTFRARLGSPLKGKITIAHGGDDKYASSFLIIDETNVRVVHMYAEQREVYCQPHGMNIDEFLAVSIDVGYQSADINIMSMSDIFKISDVDWAGRNGSVNVKTDVDIYDVKVNWYCSGYKKPIYLFGDSYFNTRDPGRWPYYLHRDGYDSSLLIGYPGMGVDRGIIDFRMAMERGKAQFVVWCLGMNNGDTDGKINARWLEATEEVVATCKKKGINLVLSTIPSTPKVNNEEKNKWVRASGLRYIDFNSAVGADKDVNWYSEMLYSDGIHPAKRGAEALYMQVLTDFPEIMEKY